MALLLTLLGIGLVLFVHELGHYLAARRAGVHVEVFALGFGPRIAGFKRGGTDYRLSLLPLGGYVLVAGESLTGAPHPGELMAASRRGRLLFYAGGIIMNFAFALLVLPLLFGIGVPFESPVLGTVEPGGAAWQAGLRTNDRITEVDGRAVHGFRHIATAAALSQQDAGVLVRGERAGADFAIEVTPVWDENFNFPSLGVGPAYEITVIPGSTAARAGLRADDEILAVNDLPLTDTRAARAALEELAFSPAPARVRYLRDGTEQRVELPVEAAPPGPEQLGVFERQDRVITARGALAEHLQPEDLLVSAGGSAVQRPEDLLRAALRAGHLPELEILREGTPLRLPARPEIAPAEIESSLQLGMSDVMRLAVRPGSPADRAGIRDGDAVLRVDTDAVRNFAELRAAIATRVAAASASGEPAPELLLTLLPAGTEHSLAVRARPEAVPSFRHGLSLRARSEVVRSANPLRAMSIGMREAWQTAAEVLLTLRRMLSGDLPASNLGGIISIGQVTHSFASQGITPLLLFLCVISINLGILNLLPLPGLDGGHMLLLLIETLRRKPVSVRARNAFNLLGFGIVIALLLFVTVLDLRRLFG